MDRSQLQELIQSDLDGELSGTERAELARLLLRDPEARRLHNEFRLTDRLLRAIPLADPPTGLRADILAAPALSVRPAVPVPRQYGWPLYRVAAAVLGGFLIVGISYVLLDGKQPGSNLQGSLNAAGVPQTMAPIASQDHLLMRAENVELNASLRRDGKYLSLELNSTATIPCEVIARIDPAMTALVGNPGNAHLSTSSGQVTVRLETGSQALKLDFSGAAPIQLELRSGGRLLGEGRLSVRDP